MDDDPQPKPSKDIFNKAVGKINMDDPLGLLDMSIPKRIEHIEDESDRRDGKAAYLASIALEAVFFNYANEDPAKPITSKDASISRLEKADREYVANLAQEQLARLFRKEDVQSFFENHDIDKSFVDFAPDPDKEVYHQSGDMVGFRHIVETVRDIVLTNTNAKLGFEETSRTVESPDEDDMQGDSAMMIEETMEKVDPHLSEAYPGALFAVDIYKTILGKLNPESLQKINEDDINGLWQLEEVELPRLFTLYTGE